MAFVVLVACLGVKAQESKPTVRHHRVTETVPDDSISPEVDQAETAMQHNDFGTAESLLQQAVTAKPADYRAWFDLGYVYNATGRLPEATEAYRKSVAAKPTYSRRTSTWAFCWRGKGQILKRSSI